MLFLVSHGLQTPLSAIRWGCSRLRRSGDNLTKQQQTILDEVQEHSRILSLMFDILLLLAKLEEGVSIPNIQEIFLYDFLQSSERLKDVPKGKQVEVTCSQELMLRIDRTILTSIIDALLLAVATSNREKNIRISVTEQKDQNTCTLTIETPLYLSVLQEMLKPEEPEKKQRIVGGVPGFLLAVIAALAKNAGGNLTSKQDADIITSLTLTLPLQPTLPAFL